MRLLRNFSGLVALPHTVFALPFALAALLLAADSGGSRITFSTFVLVILALVTARTSAMAFNRLIDARIDAENPRTSTRHIPSGLVSRPSTLLLVIVSSVLFLLCSALLGKHCLVLAPFVLLILLGYSLTKRFTSASHFVLGLALALAPGGAWWVLQPEVTATPLLLMFGVLTWVAGFDILYSLQDMEFDRKRGLFSIPASIGVRLSLGLSTALHVVAFALFLAVGVTAELGATYYLGVSGIGVLLVGQHFLISEQDLSRINHAFFTANGCISLVYLLVVVFSV